MKKAILFFIFILTVCINLLLVFKWNGSFKISFFNNIINHNETTVFEQKNIKILDDLNDDEKDKLNAYLSQLSETDIGRIKEDLNSGSLEKKENALRLMKRRLPKEQYNEAERMLNSYSKSNNIKT